MAEIENTEGWSEKDWEFIKKLRATPIEDDPDFLYQLSKENALLEKDNYYSNDFDGYNLAGTKNEYKDLERIDFK